MKEVMAESLLEKLPLSSNKPLKSHGATDVRETAVCEPNSKLEDGKISSIKDKGQESKEQEDEIKDTRPMPVWRKIAFFMSFNVWLLYFAAFIVFIPCQRDCIRDVIWTIKLNNIAITTNLVSVQGENLVIFGFLSRDDDWLLAEGNIAAFNSSSGNRLWNRTLPFVPGYIKCFSLTMNSGNPTADCVATDRANILSFRASSGHIFWHQSFPPGQKVLATDIVQISCSPNTSRIVYAVEDFQRGRLLTATDISSESEMTSVRIPCDDLPLQIAHSGSNGSSIFLLCRHEKSTSIWMVPTETLCATETSTSIETKFDHLYKFDDVDVSYVAVHLPLGEVLLGTTPNAVIVVNVSDPSETSWRVEFNDSSVLNILVGNFISRSEKEILVQLEDVNFNTQLYVLKLSDGTKTASVLIPERKPKSLLLVPGRKSADPIDTVLVGTEAKPNASTWSSNIIPLLLDDYSNEAVGTYSSNASYFVVSFAQTVTVSKVLDTSSIESPTLVYDSIAGPLMLIVDELAGGISTITGHLLNNTHKVVTCNS